MYRSIMLGMVLISLASYFLFAMKREVESLNFSLKSVRQEIREEKMNIKLLKAEFSHLTSPERLSILLKNHLALASIKPEKMVQDPLQEKNISKTKIAKKPRKLVRWRYKSKEQFILRASMKSNRP